MMQRQSVPRHKPSLSLSSMELVLSPSYASAANSSITASTASISASASASTSEGGGVSSLSSSPKKKNGNGTHDEDNASLSFHASPVGSSIPHLLSTDCDNDSGDEDNNNNNNNKGAQETYMNRNHPRHHTTDGGYYEGGFIASSTRSNSFSHRYGNNSNTDRGDDDNDQFQSMLLDQQRQADEPCLDDSVIYHHQHAGHNDADSLFTYPTQTASLPPPSSSSPLEDDVESSMSLLQTNEERSHYFQRHHHHHQHRISTGKNLLSKFSRSADSSREQAWEVVPPITMMIELDDDDEDLPWMLSQPGFGVVGTTGNHCLGDESNSSGEKEEDGQSSLLQNAEGQQQPPLTRTAPTHRRYPSSLSSTSSQSSIRSILRNGVISNSGSAESSRETATAYSTIGAAASAASNLTPLQARSKNWYDGAAAGIPENSGLNLGGVGIRKEPESLVPVGRGANRGRSVHVQGRQNQRGRRSTSHSARKSRRNDDGRGALSVASGCTGRDGHSHQHRRTVSFPAELITKDSKGNSCKTAPRHPPRDGSKSPRSLPPPGSQYDPNLTPLLDMGSSRTRKKLPAHVVQSVSEISPRTADFLAHEPMAVTALCKIQDRERYGHLLGPSTLSSAPSSTTTATPSSKLNWGCNTYPPPAASSQSPAKRSQASYQQKLQSGAANSDRSNFLGTKQESVGNAYLSPSSKMQVFGFSSANRRGRPSSTKRMRRRERMPNVDLLSPVEEMGGNTTGSTITLVATTPMATGRSKQLYSLPARRNNIDGRPSFASDGSCEIRNESTSVSPLTSELQKAADAVWRGAETSPSSASASASASSKSSFAVVTTQCQCVLS